MLGDLKQISKLSFLLLNIPVIITFGKDNNRDRMSSLITISERSEKNTPCSLS